VGKVYNREIVLLRVGGRGIHAFAAGSGERFPEKQVWRKMIIF